jgi:hypothetical protein
VLSFQERIEYLGHVIEFNKISKSPKKVRAIIDMPRPSDVEGLLNTQDFCQIISQSHILFDSFFERTQSSDGQQHLKQFSLNWKGR